MFRVFSGSGGFSVPMCSRYLVDMIGKYLKCSLLFGTLCQQHVIKPKAGEFKLPRITAGPCRGFMVTVLSWGDGVGLTADRLPLEVNLYQMQANIGMLSEHRKYLGVLPNCVVLSRTNYVRTGSQTAAI